MPGSQSSNEIERADVEMNLFLRIIFSSLLLVMTLLHVQPSRADGLPGPWPFPWAKECPMNWEDMEGRYMLSDSRSSDQVILRVTVQMKKSTRLVRVSRYTKHGSLIYDGATYVDEDQRIIRLYLSPTKSDGPPVWAVIKLHYQSWEVDSCSADRLVPILTVGTSDPYDPSSNQYKMIKVY
jgi:hypothetical protein